MASVWKKSAFKKGLAVVGSAAVIVMGFDYVTYAATGSSLLLGLHNSESTPTYITNTGAGAPLALIARSTTYPPFVTNAKGLVANLYASRAYNADRLGGYTASQLLVKATPSTITYYDGANHVGSDPAYASITVPAGTWLVSLDADVALNTAGTPTAPNQMSCFLYSSTVDIGQSTVTDIGRWYTAPSFSRVVQFSASTVLQPVCKTNTGDGWTLPSYAFGPTFSFTKLGAVTAHSM